MKITKQKHIDYDNLGYSESSGWQPMYDWNKIKNIIRWGGRIVAALSAMAGIILFRFVFDIKSAYNSTTSLLLALLTIFIYIIILVPVHEILHLIAYTLNIFSEKCHIMIGLPTVSAFYDGIISRKKALFSLVLPFIVLSVVLICVGIILRDFLPWLSLLIIMNTGGSWVDIFMFFYLSKKIPKNAIIYGNRYKISIE